MTTLTNLIPTIYESLDTVSRELVGYIPAVTRDSSMARASIGQTIKSHRAPAAQAVDIEPGVTAPDNGDQTIGNFDVTMTKSRAVPIRWKGEEGNALAQGGGRGRRPIMADQFEQAFRTLCNEVEVDLGGLAVKSSRAYGTPGTLPFANNGLDESAELRKILDDNGCPGGARSVVLDTRSGATLRKVPNLTKVNESGGSQFLRQGVLGELHGFNFRESAGVRQHVKGTSNGHLVNKAGGLAVGDTTIPADTGTGTILAGDVVTFNGDTENKYVVTEALNGGNFKIGAPGIRAPIADNAAITVLNGGPRMMAFQRSALLLATRAPIIPEEGDMADDAMFVTDEHSGLIFEVRLYKQYRQVRYEVCLAWGVANVKDEHTALLLR